MRRISSTSFRRWHDNVLNSFASDEALECLETLVLSFLTQLLDAYSESGTKKGNGKKVVLRIADRRKESSDQ